jgi:hypothetical protein
MIPANITEFIPYIIPVLLLEWALMIIAIVDLVKREKTKSLPKWGWALIIIFFQIFGPILYFIIGRED